MDFFFFEQYQLFFDEVPTSQAAYGLCFQLTSCFFLANVILIAWSMQLRLLNMSLLACSRMFVSCLSRLLKILHLLSVDKSSWTLRDTSS